MLYKKAVADADEWGRLYKFKDGLDEQKGIAAALESHATVISAVPNPITMLHLTTLLTHLSKARQ